MIILVLKLILFFKKAVIRASTESRNEEEECESENLTRIISIASVTSFCTYTHLLLSFQNVEHVQEQSALASTYMELLAAENTPVAYGGSRKLNCLVGAHECVGNRGNCSHGYC